MFVLKKDSSYVWPVTVSSPVSGGKFEKQTFDLTFKRLAQSRLKDVLNAEVEISDAEFCREIVLGWAGIKDESGSDVPFSVAALDELLEIPALGKQIVNAYLESLAPAKTKN